MHQCVFLPPSSSFRGSMWMRRRHIVTLATFSSEEPVFSQRLQRHRAFNSTYGRSPSLAAAAGGLCVFTRAAASPEPHLFHLTAEREPVLISSYTDQTSVVFSPGPGNVNVTAAGGRFNITRDNNNSHKYTI